jgi:hypothetical protein
VHSYLKLGHLQLQEQIMISIADLAKTVSLALKSKLGEEEDSHREGRRDAQSVVYWLINFTPKSSEVKGIGLNSHSILELASSLLPKTGNLCVIEALTSFFRFLFQHVATFGEMLFLITELIRYEFPNALDDILKKIMQRELRAKDMYRHYIQFDLLDFYGRSYIEPFKLKEMMKVQKINEKGFTHGLRELNRQVHQFNEEFNRYRLGKITFKRMVSRGGVSQEEVEEREILNIERLAEESHHQSKAQEIISMELYHENEELIKVNKWLEERIRQYEETISTMVHVNTKGSVRSKLRFHREVIR